MYCEYCGKKIDLDSTFCVHCGEKIDLDSTFCVHCGEKIDIEETQKLSIKNNNERKFLLFILLLFFFVLFFFWNLKKFNSPENVVERYMHHWKQKNYSAILQDLDIESSDFVNESVFEKMYSMDSPFYDFEVVECKEQREDNFQCVVDYQRNKNSVVEKKKIYLQKKDIKKQKLLVKWKVQDEDIKIQNDFKFYFPNYAEVSLNGVSLDEFMQKKTDKNGFDCYKIPSILGGNYELLLTFDNELEIKKNISVSKKEYIYQFSVEDLSLDYRNSIEKLVTETLHSLYSGVTQKKKLEELTFNEVISSLKDTYESLLSVGLTKFSIINMEVFDVNLNEDGNLVFTLQMDYEYELEYTEDTKEVIHNGKSNDTFYVLTKDIKNKEIIGIRSLVTYFSKKY